MKSYNTFLQTLFTRLISGSLTEETLGGVVFLDTGSHIYIFFDHTLVVADVLTVLIFLSFVYLGHTWQCAGFTPSPVLRAHS